MECRENKLIVMTCQKKKKTFGAKKEEGFKPRKKVKKQETGDLVETLFSMIRIVK